MLAWIAAGMFADPDFQVRTTVDKRGRKVWPGSWFGTTAPVL